MSFIQVMRSVGLIVKHLLILRRSFLWKKIMEILATIMSEVITEPCLTGKLLWNIWRSRQITKLLFFIVLAVLSVPFLFSCLFSHLDCVLIRYPYANDQHVFWEILVKKHFPAVIQHVGLCKVNTTVTSLTSSVSPSSSTLTFCNLDSCLFASCSLASKEDYRKLFSYFLFSFSLL
jgi:hypothetical protein